MEPRPRWWLDEDVAEAMDGTALPVGAGPQLGDGTDQAGCPVGDHQQRTAQAAAREAPSQVQPVLGGLALNETDVEQHPLALGREAPGHEQALLGAVGVDGQVDGVSEERQEADVGQAPARKARWRSLSSRSGCPSRSTRSMAASILELGWSML